MKFVLVETQGGGCDYTIGCGVRVSEVKAKTFEEAKAKAVKDLVDSWQGGDERDIDGATLYAVSETIDLASLLDAAKVTQQQKREKARLAKLEKEQLKQYEKLHAKFGSSPKPASPGSGSRKGG